MGCHRCLLPFAKPWQVDSVSRATAERHLRAMLTAGTDDAEPATEMTWTLTVQEPASPPVESHLEQSFRAVFAARVTGLGAAVKESPGPHGNRLTITFPNTTRQWTLEPQVLLTGSKSDFVLSSSQASLPPVAIFTDSRQYHASTTHNRIAEDAQKRTVLRDGGAIVLAITATDVQNAQTGAALAARPRGGAPSVLAVAAAGDAQKKQVSVQAAQVAVVHERGQRAGSTCAPACRLDE